MSVADAVTRYGTARDLPPAWDRMAPSVFQTRAFLVHTEATHPCAQRYYVFSPAGRPSAGAIVYHISLDLLTYRGLRSPLPMQVVGVPCSVGWPGLLGEAADHPWLLAGVRRAERGFLLGLNTLHPISVDGLPQGATLPTVVLDRAFPSIAAYRRALRSDYRRRFDRIRTAFAGLVEARGPCTGFTAAHHRLYLEAFERSSARLEKLPLPFFVGLPAPFRLTDFREAGTGRLVGWHVSAFEEAGVTFFMGGVDQDLRDDRRTYHNLLFSVLEQAFEAGARRVDLGQTAEVAKTRAGGRLEPRGMFAWPRSRLLRTAVHLGRGLLEYRVDVPEARVFRDGVP